jgi:hypothetical protein
MKEKLNVAFIYKKNYPLTTEEFWSTMHYNFFMKALKRNSRINVTYFACDETFDISKYENVCDVVLLMINDSECTPNILGIDKIKIPVISSIGDPQENVPREKFHKKWKINAYFSWLHEEFFYKYYPKDYQFNQIWWGIEPSLYTNIKPYNQRIKDKILNSGSVGNLKPFSRLYNFLSNPKNNSLHHYKLRTWCNKLSYVDYTPTLDHEFIRDKYTLHLQKYRASISASSYFLVAKYFEIPASGCLTFMEITEKNHGEMLGYEDYKSAIFINKENYKEKFNEYLNDLDNPKWEKIAQNGREFALKKFSNDKGVNDLVDLMENLIENNIF